jgi:hypothetical protein
MDSTTILRFSGDAIDLGASVTAYTEMIEQQGFPEAHSQLLHELRAWVEATPTLPGHPIERLLEVESAILMDAGVAGVAAEHLPFLYTSIGQVFADRGHPLRQALLRAAKQAEAVHEDAIQHEMQETGSDRLEVIPYMESVALERLQERQERVLSIVTSLTSEGTERP